MLPATAFLLLLLATSAGAANMRAMRTTAGGCAPPFTCVSIVDVPAPVPKPRGEIVIKVQSSSVNPSDVDELEAGACADGSAGCGADVSGVVTEVCADCTKLQVGDKVWTLASGAYSEYVTAQEAQTGLMPTNLDFTEAATVPEVGLTSLLSLKRTGSLPGTPLPSGSPWTSGNFSNLTVLVTAGSGGTGSIGIELAKAWGAKHIATSTTGAAGIAFVRSLGATFVTDYLVEDLFDALPENSVDIVYDNYGAEGTADKAMKVLRAGGTYLLMPHGECYEKKTQGPPCLSAHPKKGVRQLNYVTGPDFEAHAQEGLTELKSLFELNKLKPHVNRTFSLDDIAQAFMLSAGHGEGGVSNHLGKIAINIAKT